MKPHKHRWAPTALYIDGVLSAFCLDPACTAGLQGETVVPGLFPWPDGLVIDDDPEGGVAKLVAREIQDSYFPADFALADGDVVLDIGAHVGVVSLYVAKRWPQARVYAFEPWPVNYARLERNIRANGASKVRAFNMALSANGRPLTLYGAPQRNSGGPSAFGAGGYSARVASVTLAQVFERLHIERCALLKVDCEGAEHEVLRASAGLLKRVDWLIGEFHDSARLAAMGFRARELAEWCAGIVGKDRVRVTICRMGD